MPAPSQFESGFTGPVIYMRDQVCGECCMSKDEALDVGQC
jgi:hypothetical protein